MYSLHTSIEPPTPEINITGINHCVSTATVKSCTNKVTVTVHSIKHVCTPTTVYASVCSSPIISIKSQITMTTTVLNMSVFTQISYPLSPSCSPASETCASTMHAIPLTIVAPAIGALVVLLLVVTTGWVCTCRIMKKRGKMEINVMQDRYNL